MPALLIRTSGVPNSSIVVASAACQSSSTRDVEVHVAARVAEAIGGGLALVVEHVADDDPCALVDEQLGFGRTLTAGAARDQRDLAL